MDPTPTPTPTPSYQIGDRVQRIETRDVTAATVITIETVGDDIVLELQYDEGGTGWWPATSVRPN